MPSVSSSSITTALALSKEIAADVREDAALANGSLGDKFVHFLVVLHGHHEVSWHDRLLLVLSGTISR